MSQQTITKSPFQCTRFTHDRFCRHYGHADNDPRCSGDVPTGDWCGSCMAIEIIRIDQIKKCIALVEGASYMDEDAPPNWNHAIKVALIYLKDELEGCGDTCTARCKEQCKLL